MNWILLSPPPLSSDPDNPPKFGTCTFEKITLHNPTSIIYTWWGEHNQIQDFLKNVGGRKVQIWGSVGEMSKL